MNKTIAILLIVLGSFSSITANPDADTLSIKKHLQIITKTFRNRNHNNIEALNKTANYISENFKKYSDSVSFQEYTVNGQTYKNVICSIGDYSKGAKTIIVGAHYDVCGDQEGADDNASGVVGLLELSRLLHNKYLPYRIQLVAYTLEEPPFFNTINMGSYIHAQSLVKNKTDIYGMISLEMIGYFSDTVNSQSYPIPSLSTIYGTKGDFITLVDKENSSVFSNTFNTLFKQQNLIKTVIFNSPASLPSIDFSDHLNYWKHGFDALMITDTAFFRNKNYHTKYDTMEKLNIKKMAKVIDATYRTLISLE